MQINEYEFIYFIQEMNYESDKKRIIISLKFSMYKNLLVQV
jgi:hypothetical protein